MATSFTNIVLGSVVYKGALTPPSSGKLLASSATLCPSSCAQGPASQRRSWGNILVLESSGPRRRRLGYQQRRLQQLLLQQLQSAPSSPSFCLSTDISSNASTSTAEGNESAIRIEKKNAIAAFEAGELVADELGLEGQEDEQEAVPVIEEREQEAAALQRRASKAVKGQAATVASIVAMFMGLLDRLPPNDGRMIGGAGSAVMERVEEEVAKLQEVDSVDRQSVFEILRLVKLLQMDVQLIAAARKENTLSERLVEAKAHCRQFLNILNVF